MSTEKVQKKISSDIEKVGWSMVSVFAEKNRPSFSYTVGRHEKGRADIIVFAMPPEVAHAFAKIIIDLEDSGKPMELGKSYTEHTSTGLPLMLIECGNVVKDEYTFMATRHYGHTAYRVLQLVWSDPQGKFPWEDGFDERFRERQPICGQVVMK